MVGKTLGHYEILEPLGAGGMGEVYRARDTKLGRDVAIKVLPEDFASDPDLVARLEREAKLLAALNHPNITTIHGLEEEEGARFLVLELVKGESLKQRLSRGPLSIENTLDVCQQIAAALEAAHSEGIIHRDLKPANVLITPDGRAKVLDFGIAKSMKVGDDVIADTAKATDLTVTGTLVGTPAYMSPEQVRGEPIDKRADIWAFGCLLYEALAGKSAFGRETLADTLAAVVDQEPGWEALPESSARHLHPLIRRCLRKNPNRRLHDIADARIEIEEASSGSAEGSVGGSLGGTLGGAVGQAPGATSPAAWPGARTLGWGAVTVLAVGAAFLAGRAGRSTDGVLRYSIPVPAPLLINAIDAPPLALSPDGEVLVFAAIGPDGISHLYKRRLTGLERPERIAGTEWARSPFFSPDGNWIGFVGPGYAIHKVPLGQGKAIRIASVLGAPFGLDWAADDTIYFAVPQGLMKVETEADSTPTRLAMAFPDTASGPAVWPQLLPGDRHLMFAAQVADGWELVALDLETGQRSTLVPNIEAAQAHYVPSGHLVYVQSDQVLAVPFDLETLSRTGSAVPVIPGVFVTRYAVFNAAYFTYSDSGALVYITAAGEIRSGLVWKDPEGGEETLVEGSGLFGAPSISPTGDRVVVARREVDSSIDIMVYSTDGRELARLGAGLPAKSQPIWTPDGERIAYTARTPPPGAIYWQSADGSDDPVPLVSTGELPHLGSWSPDGRTLTFYQSSLTGGFDLWTLTLGGEPQPLIANEDMMGGVRFSPATADWFTYFSNETGPFDTWVARYPYAGRKYRISADGGAEPVWSKDGRTLYYRRGHAMMAVDLQFEPEFFFAPPRPVLLEPFDLSIGYTQNFDVSRDGRFLMVRADRPEPQLNVILNWFEELKERVPTGGR